MTSKEEKIREFLNSEEKVRALANDEAFIEKVSGGTATPETYQEEFKKFDIELGDQDATQTKNVVDKVFEKSAEKLDDKFLKEVSGGGSVRGITTVLGAGSFISGLGCSIATCVYISKANKAISAGNTTDYNRYITKSQNCGIAAATMIGSSLVCELVYTAVGIANSPKAGMAKK